ncbi:MAG TPA: protein translocase subunit SecD [Candidatus Acidoferrum sp.]|nr:protein translocase subunit SecD [Candidatus Acidoferrum sp.]
MNRSLLWRFLLIVFVVAGCITFAWPPRNRPLVEVFQEKLQRRDPNIDAVLKRFNELQTANPQAEFKNLREAVGTNDLTKYFEFDFKTQKDPGALKDPNSAILNWIQRSAAGKIRLGLDLQGGSAFLVQLETGKLATNTTKEIAVNNAVEVLRKRVDRFGVAEPLIQPVGDDRIAVQMPGLSESDMDSVRVAIQKAAFLEFRWVHDENQTLLQQSIVPPGYQRMRHVQENQRGETQVSEYIVSRTAIPGLNGKNLKNANMSRGLLGEPEIHFLLDTEGATAFAKITTENRGRFMAIILDGELYSAPRINEPITGGSGQITGQFTEKEAADLAAILQNPLEAPVKVLSEERVDPSLGRDTIRSGINSALYATIAVAAFMAIYYMFAGMVANVALLTNIVVLLGVMASIKTTLTLPGIAGIVLTVGMAVDANVLIFERIREELAKGKSLRAALAAGYDRAFGTIFDSHVTTLISSIILWYLGTGTIKGFGVALTIGVAASLFTALVVTRVIFDFMLAQGWLKSMRMLHIIKAPKVDFMKFAKPAFAVSWIIIIVGVAWGLHRGFNKRDILGIDFVGGDNLTLAFREKIDVDKIRDVVTPISRDSLIQYQRAMAGTDEKLRITIGIPKDGNPDAAANAVVSGLQKTFPQAGFELKGSERVGATVGEEILRSAVIATLLSLLGILVYVAFRYEFSFAVAAVVAILHDVLMTMGIYSLTSVWGHGRELNATMVAALLTIIGFSINDTIVIFDRIREDLKLGVRGTFRELINQALNQTLSRTIITSGTVFIATMALYLFGGGAINDFAFTFLVGIITGTYSSMYIASALVLWWHKGQRPATGSKVMMQNEMGATKPVKTVQA